MKNLFQILIFFCFFSFGFATEKTEKFNFDDYAYDTCIDVEFSCGHQGTVCGDDLVDAIEWALIWDNEICG